MRLNDDFLLVPGVARERTDGVHPLRGGFFRGGFCKGSLGEEGPRVWGLGFRV